MNTSTSLKIKTYCNKITGVLLLFVLMASSINSFSQCSTPTYCNGNVTNVGGYGIGIANVTLGSSINNTTTALATAPNYFDFTNLALFSSAGSTVSLSVTNGPSNSTRILMYIDYNQDGTFGTSAPELVWSSTNTTSSAVVTGSFTIPSSQGLGSYRIRVTGDFGGSTSYNPCQLNYGEVEDYSLIIGGATPNISAVASTPNSFGIGNNTVTVTAKNLSTTTITALDFGYTCTNGQTVTPSSVTGLSIAAGGSYVYTFATALSLTAGSYTLKIWTNNPNGVQPDANVCGDTITVSACTGMSGAFTINPGGSGASNFTTFTACATRLSQCGVAGPVTITVTAGTYNEQFSMGTIAGASATNTIVFDGVDTATRKVSFATGATLTSVIELNGSDYVTFKNLTIENTSTSNTYVSFYAVHLKNAANYNKFIGCKMVMATSASPYYYAVPLGICGNNYYDAADHGNFNLFTGNKLIGGYIGIALMGATNPPVMSAGNSFIDNIIQDAWQYGIYVNYQSGLNFEHNVVNMDNRMASSYGLYVYYVNTTNLNRNVVNASYYGILFYTYSYYAPTGNCSISNNIINTIGTSAQAYAMYMNNAERTTISHNTVNHTRPGGYALYCFISGTANKMNNNIFSVTNAAALTMYVGNVSTAYFTSFDYNTLSAPASSPIFAYFGGNYATLSALKLANTSFNQNSNNVAPVFVSSTDMHLSPAVDQARGIAGLGIPTDIDGDTRCVFAPSIGADESQYITPPPTAGFTTGTVYVNSPVTFLNNYSALLPMFHQWYVDGVPVSNLANYTRTFTATGTYNVALKSVNCSGSDSVNVVITVTTPNFPPTSDFIADRSVVNTYENVKFTDLSSNGPTIWAWTVTPGTLGIDYAFASGSTASSQNPTIYFINSGNYNICLRASNVAGTGSNRCKTNYIIVQAAQSMCIFPFSTNVAIGNLFSSGGPAGGYGQNENCTYTIDACADSTFLKVNSASFGTGTVDRFEIYQGDYTPGKTPVAVFMGNTTYTLPQVIAVKGKMTVREATDATANNGTGIKANWYISTGTFAAPSGTIIGSSNAYFCASGIYNFYSSSFRDPSYTYEWDFDNDGITDVLGMDGYFAYGSTGGPDTCKLKISGCGGTITLWKVITVIAPPTPTAAFTSNLFTATPTDTVQFIDESLGGVLTWNWTITGTGPVNYVGGTSSTSRSPKVICPVAGNYNAKLIVTNCTGTDSITKTNHFKILGYCEPAVGTLSPDLAITNFQMGSINNTITTPAPGTVAYRNFSQNLVTNTDRGATYSFSITRNSNYNAAGMKIWVDWNQDGTFSTAELAASTIITGTTWNSTLFTPKTATLGATRLRIGVAYNTGSNTPCGANAYGEFQDYRVNVRPDVTAPELVLGGTNPTYVEIGRNFVETGDVAIDAVDGTVTDSISYSGYITGRGYQMPITKQATALGTFNVAVMAEDLSDNEVTVNRTVIVTADTTKPVITLNGTNPMYVEVYTSFVNPGATATDFYFTNAITVNSTNNVDTAKLGSYMATYTATDINGNNAEPVIRTVIVRDGQKPVINLPANTDTVYVEVRSNYIDAGATVTDNYDSGLTASWTGSVNTYVPGTYTYTFNATDASGNTAIPRVRVIIVRDKTAPDLVLASPADPDTLVLEAKAFTIVPEPGFVATDNYYASSQITVSKSGSVDLNKIGIYVVTYIATDPAGNSSAPKRRIYKLVDSTKPVLTMLGSNSVNICRWRTYTDLGASVSDNYWTGLQVVSSSNLDINLPGIYTITYNVTDSSGNAATPIVRYVNVLDNNSSSCQQFSGISTNGNNASITIAPNPSNGVVTIEIATATEKKSEVTIYNSLGQVVRVLDNALSINAKYTVDLQGEASGIYFVTVKSDNNTTTKKFVLNK